MEVLAVSNYLCCIGYFNENKISLKIGSAFDWLIEVMVNSIKMLKYISEGIMLRVKLIQHSCS